VPGLPLVRENRYPNGHSNARRAVRRRLPDREGAAGPRSGTFGAW
jgi:hypothetical protein